MLLMMLTLDSNRIIHHGTNTALELHWACPLYTKVSPRDRFSL
jgi:hypothetical protein